MRRGFCNTREAAIGRLRVGSGAIKAMPEETAYQTEKLETRTRFEIRPAVFIPAASIIIAFVVLGVLFTDALAALFGRTEELIASWFGWFYIVSVTVFLGFVIWLGLSQYGSKRLGPDDSRPDYGHFAWFAMLFSAGMGIGLLFFSVAEPISHYGLDVPPFAEARAESPEAAREAMTFTYVHWGLHAWAIYVVVGLALCYYAYRRNLPLTLRSAFYPLIGGRIHSWMGDAIDTLAIVGTLFGVATSLGIGAIQINAGLNFVFGIEPGDDVRLVIVVGITMIATASVVAGLDRGIRRLSILNALLFSVLCLFILFVGPTQLLLNAFVDNAGRYVQRLPERSLAVPTFAASSAWQTDWTLFYWGWWVSWSPFVGMFIARISRGRTIREFVLGILLVPTVVTFAVLTIFGHTAIASEVSGPGGIVEVAEENLDFALFEMLGQLPLATLTSLVAIAGITTFFITSSDSGSLVDDIHASGGSLEPHAATRVFWALAEGSVAVTLLLAGGETGLEALQRASLATGVPLAVLMLGICYALIRALRSERISGVGPAPAAHSGE